MGLNCHFQARSVVLDSLRKPTRHAGPQFCIDECGGVVGRYPRRGVGGGASPLAWPRLLPNRSVSRPAGNASHRSCSNVISRRCRHQDRKGKSGTLLMPSGNCGSPDAGSASTDSKLVVNEIAVADVGEWLLVASGKDQRRTRPFRSDYRAQPRPRSIPPASGRGAPMASRDALPYQPPCDRR